MGSKHVNTEGAKKGISSRLILILAFLVFSYTCYMFISISNPEIWDPLRDKKITGN